MYQTIGDAVVYVAGMESLDWKQRQIAKSHSATSDIAAAKQEESFCTEKLVKNAAKAVSCAIAIVNTVSKATVCPISASMQCRKYNALVRIGCSCGNILGGIASRYKFAFDIYGTAVDTAEYLASVQTALSISIDDQTLQAASKVVAAQLFENSNFSMTKGSGKNVEYVSFSANH